MQDATTVAECGTTASPLQGDDYTARLHRQRELEEQSVSLGRERFQRRLDQAKTAGEETKAGAALKLFRDAIQPTEGAIEGWLQSQVGKRGARPVALKWITEVGAEHAAYLTCQSVLNTVGRRANHREVCLRISDRILDELHFRRFRDQAPQLWDYKVSAFSTSNYQHQARSIHASMRYESIDLSDLDMDRDTRFHVGNTLVNLMLQACPTLVRVEEIKTNIGGRKGQVRTEKYLTPTMETLEWLSARNGALEALFPVNLPMVVPPLPWQPGEPGGYMYALRGKHRMVRGVSKGHRRTLDQTTMPTVYAAVNRIQNTPWKINENVLSLIEEIIERGGGIAGIPRQYDQDLPVKPHDIAENEEARKAWRKLASVVKEANHQAKVMRRATNLTLSMAERFSGEREIYFPCNLDFRGRVYPIPNHLTPQGDDLQKGLLMFAHGKPLGREGVTALALHGANCLGVTPTQQKISKMTLAERQGVIRDLTPSIRLVARDPIGNQWWTEADDPFQFYAFCVEWDAAFSSGNPAAYVCSLPCSVDGTCNGLQHFAALLRDEEGAAAVNVVPVERPQDVYQMDADYVTERLEQDAAGGDVLARLWLTSGLLGRKLCKRPTMTFAYGSKRFGFKEQLKEELRSRPEWKQIKAHFTILEDDKQKNKVAPACAYMSGLIWDGLQDIVRGAAKGMEWMQRCARQVGANGRCVEWTVPATGFRVRQEYYHSKKRQIQTMLAGKIYKPVVHDQLATINVMKQANAVSPNFVHSLDAAALMLTVEMAALEGIEAFAMVHDSYGTLPADLPLLGRCTREAFFRLYAKHDPLGSLAAQFAGQVEDPAKLPAAPAMGSLDVSRVLASPYFFC